ncbi:proline/glycine betaine transporter [Salmonella enterica subsp. enterica]|uniref:Proline/glycine betaine transporter n=1 Tax=Salmonella enterica I TaxID=59201 RepID=A0A379VY80_SALET|nr:proline/glycine betaine transporter [Salmonella enterica subsp. enterica]
MSARRIFLEWGWRIPFFIALPLGIIGLYLRHALEETPAFQQHVDKLEQGDREGLQDGPKVSFKEIATKHWRSLLSCIGLVIATNVTYYMLLTYMPSYLSHNLHYSEDHGVLIIIAIMIGMLFVQPVMGLLSDRFGRRPFVIMGSIALFALAIPAFILINSNVIGLIFCRFVDAGGDSELLYRGDGLDVAGDVSDAYSLQRAGGGF